MRFSVLVRGLSTQAVRKHSPEPHERVYVAMSAGVDSSTVAALMREKYKDVRGVFMANWSSTSKCMGKDWDDVQRVCKHLDISCERVSFEKDYWHEVFQPTLDLYQRGKTPNPDVACNRHVKFGSLLNYLKCKDAGPWWLATGHYARLSRIGDSLRLMRPRDLAKDQSYYLSSVELSAFEKVFFPLENLTKPEVRHLASEFDLHVAEKKDSQGLCFVSQSQRNFRDFLSDYLAPNPGDVVLEDGTIVGKHEGLWSATIGQRSSLSLPQGDPKFKGSWFVGSKNAEANQLVIVKGRDNPSLYAQAALCGSFNWHIDAAEVQNLDPSELTIQYRSLQDPEPLADLRLQGAGVEVTFSQKRRAVAPGQYLVVYRREEVLGNGVITSTL